VGIRVLAKGMALANPPLGAQALTSGVAFWFCQRVPSKLCSNCFDAPLAG